MLSCCCCSDAKSYDSLWCSLTVMPSLEFANKMANGITRITASLHLADVASGEAPDDVIGMQAGEASRVGGSHAFCGDTTLLLSTAPHVRLLEHPLVGGGVNSAAGTADPRNNARILSQPFRECCCVCCMLLLAAVCWRRFLFQSGPLALALGVRVTCHKPAL